jgi:hypothetical protein
MLSSVSSKVRGWEKYFFVEVLMTSSTLGACSNYLAVPGEDPSPISSSFSLGSLGECLVVGFLSGIFPTTREEFIDHVRNHMNIQIMIIELKKLNTCLYSLLNLILIILGSVQY